MCLHPAVQPEHCDAVTGVKPYPAKEARSFHVDMPFQKFTIVPTPLSILFTATINGTMQGGSET